MKISFAICTRNEGDYIRQLLTRLTKFIQYDRSGVDYEIVVVDDYSTDTETVKILDHFITDSIIKISLYHHPLDNNFADHKNYLIEKCTGDFILNLDADEFVTDEFLGSLHIILEGNPDVDAYWLPRVNTVEGLTREHVTKYFWTYDTLEPFKKIRHIPAGDELQFLQGNNYVISNENDIVTYYEPIICWPDYQMRLFRNNKHIHWVNKVHEKLVGFTKFVYFPKSPEWAIRHFKTIDRQIHQNNLYENIQKRNI